MIRILAAHGLSITAGLVLALPSDAAQDIVEENYLIASNPDTSDFFGTSVAASADTLVVGAWGERSAATGVNGDQSNDMLGLAGAAYVFVRSGSVWTQQAYLKASNTGNEDRFGASVAISGDTIVVGAPFERSASTGVNGNDADNSAFGSGAAYVFVRSGSTWSQQAYLKASNTQANDTFGVRVAISGDTIVATAIREDSNATGVNGDQSNNDAEDSGAAYVFVRSGSTWSQEAYLKASNAGSDDEFGRSVAVEGDRIVVGAQFEGSNATGIDGDETNDLAPDSGAAYVFVRSGSSWSQEAYLKASNTDSGDWFGGDVSLSDGTIVVGAFREDSSAIGIDPDPLNNNGERNGAAYVFVQSGPGWVQDAYLKAINTNNFHEFGTSVSISGDTIVVGSPREGGGATGVDCWQGFAVSTGAAYVFRRRSGTWKHQAYLKASNAEAQDRFGLSVSVSGDTLIVGAPDEDGSFGGFSGNAGAAYAFDLGLASEPGTPYCAGDGGDAPGCTPCPCNNDGAPGVLGGCRNRSRRSCQLSATGNASVSNDTLQLHVSGANANVTAILVSGTNLLPASGACLSGSGVQTGGLDGLRCVGGNLIRFNGRATNSCGKTEHPWGPPFGPTNGVLSQVGLGAGQTRYFQCIYRDDPGQSCTSGFNTSNALEIVAVP